MDALEGISACDTRPIGGDVGRHSYRFRPRISMPSIGFVGNALPRLCGIATFTTDLQQAVAALHGVGGTTIVAMTDRGQSYLYPPNVALEIAEEQIGDYRRAAHHLNNSGVDVVCLQHEFGIFGGEAGEHVLALAENLTVPLITTLHTVLEAPTSRQRSVVEAIGRASSNIVVMAKKGRDLLIDNYDVDADKVTTIAHGIPDYPLVQPAVMKEKLGFDGRTIILTFGLLSPNKGIEVMIDAMPAILRTCPDALYVVLGATHPRLVHDHGEAYRASLMQRARVLGVERQVLFIDRFVDRPTLLDYIAMCDVYVTPYLSEAQLTSGTLAYSFGLGKPIVSTPYWHAAELLAGGRGILVPFADPEATGREIAALLADTDRRVAMGKRAYAESRSMTWDRTALRYLDLFRDAADWSADVQAFPDFLRRNAG